MKTRLLVSQMLLASRKNQQSLVEEPVDLAEQPEIAPFGASAPAEEPSSAKRNSKQASILSRMVVKKGDKKSSASKRALPEAEPASSALAKATAPPADESAKKLKTGNALSLLGSYSDDEDAE